MYVRSIELGLVGLCLSNICLASTQLASKRTLGNVDRRTQQDASLARSGEVIAACQCEEESEAYGKVSLHIFPWEFSCQILPLIVSVASGATSR